jgi:cytoskeletal protein CcmA (bactofilin family)
MVMKSRKYIEEPAVTLIGKGMQVNADLLGGTGNVRIEGEYHGDINIDGELTVERSGHIKGHISATVANISGSITGDIICSDLLHIKTTGKIKGDIACDAILMDEGALFIGRCTMNEIEPEPDPLGIEIEE